MKVKRMGIKEILRRIWLQTTQLIVKLNSSLWHIIVTVILDLYSENIVYFKIEFLRLQQAEKLSSN